MHDIEPFYGWEGYYKSENDPKSPFYKTYNNPHVYTHHVYDHYIHPDWCFIESETLYIKILSVDYKKKYAILEFIGEWNDALHNDIMFLKRKVIDILVSNGIKHFVLIGEQVFNFHGSDDSYYEEWFEDIENGWIAAVNFREFIYKEWHKFMIDAYINCEGALEIESWRTSTPDQLFTYINSLITRRLN